MGEYDKSSKWLIEHHGDSILRLAGLHDVVSWRPLPAELVQPGQLPDGLLEVRLAGRDEPDLFILELATYPENRLLEQLARDSVLVYLNRRKLPEVLALVLHPKGKLRVSDAIELQSPLGWTTLSFRWRIVELWTIPAEQLLAESDPGIIPWVPLTQFEGPPETLLSRCRARIDQLPASDERKNLLAVTQILAKLRYNDPQILKFLGGRNAMIESPLIDELLAENRHNVLVEARHKDILRFLKTRFGAVDDDLLIKVRAITDEQKLDDLLDEAALGPDLNTFQAKLGPGE